MSDMENKSKYEWLEEADRFLFNWTNATGRDPLKEEVIAECIEFNDPPYNTREYGETLWSYITELFE